MRTEDEKPICVGSHGHTAIALKKGCCASVGSVLHTILPSSSIGHRKRAHLTYSIENTDLSETVKLSVWIASNNSCFSLIILTHHLLQWGDPRALADFVSCCSYALPNCQMDVILDGVPAREMEMDAMLAWTFCFGWLLIILQSNA